MRQLLAVAPKNTYFGTFCQVNRETPLTEFFSSISAGCRVAVLSVVRLYHGFFRGNVAERFRTTISPLIHGEMATSQPAFTCSKLTTETLEQGVGVVLISLLLTLNIFHTLF